MAKFDLEKMAARIGKMRGSDWVRVEDMMASLGKAGADMWTRTELFACVASIALDVPLPEIKELPMGEYLRVTNRAASLLGELLGGQVQLNATLTPLSDSTNSAT